MHESMISRLRRRLGAVLALKKALGLLTLWTFVWGIAVLVGRVIIHEVPEWWWWGLAAAPVAIGAATWAGLKQLPSRSDLRALLDKTSHCGGLLMASEQEPLGPWRETLPEAAALRVRWRGGRAWSIFLTACVFLGVTLLFPQSLVSWAEPPLEIGTEVDKLAGQIDVLKQESVLEQTRAEFLKEKLKQVKNEASGKDPVKTLEALDHVREMINQAAKEAAEAALQKTEKLGKAEGLAEGVRQNEGELDPKVRKEAMDELAGLVQKAALETNLLGKHLDPELLKQLQASKLSPEQMKKLAEALRGAKTDLAKMLHKLHAAKLIDLEFVKLCEKAGECNCTGMLKEQGGKMTVAAILGKCQGKCPGGVPGIGGVTEGPGHAELAWNQNTKEEGAKFKEEVLPPGELAKLKDSLVLGVGKVDPKTGKEISVSQGGTLSINKGGGAAHTQTVLPQHKAAVEKFFARPKDK